MPERGPILVTAEEREALLAKPRPRTLPIAPAAAPSQRRLPLAAESRLPVLGPAPPPPASDDPSEVPDPHATSSGKTSQGLGTIAHSFLA